MKQGWVEKKLGQILQIERGGSPRPIKKYLTDDPDGLNWIKIGDATASTKYIYHTKQKITKDGLHKTRLVKEGDFILSNSMSFGKPYIMKTTGCIHDGWLVLKEKDGFKLNQDFLYHLLCSPYLFKQFDGLAAGSTVRNLNIALVSSVTVRVPPLEEQKQIVAKLDQCFEAIDKARANAVKNLENAKELFQSKLNDIFSQKGEGWVEKKLGDVCENLDSKRIPITKNKRTEGNIPYYGASGVVDHVNEYIFNEDLLLVSEDGANLLARTYPIAFSISGKTWVNNHAHVLKFQSMAAQRFIEYYLNSIKLDDYVSGMAQPKLNQRMLNSISVPNADEHIQKDVVSRLDELKEQTKSLESKYQQELNSLEELKKSILQKAFEGEL
jgi:type I restriction enzyme, S subunit